MKIEILGAKCANCSKLAANVWGAVDDLHLSPDPEIIKVEDPREIADRGNFSLPALAIDGAIVSSGVVPTRSEVMSMITTALVNAEA